MENKALKALFCLQKYTNIIDQNPLQSDSARWSPWNRIQVLPPLYGL